MEDISNNDSLENRLSGVTVVADTHSNVVPIRKAFEYSQERKNDVLHNGDVVGDYNLLEIGSNLELKTSMEIVDEFMQENLSQHQYQTFMTFQEIQQVGGYDNYLALIQKHNDFSINQMKELNNNLMKFLEYGQSEVFQEKIKSLEQRFQFEKQDELIENQLRYNALYEVICQEQGKDLADLLNEFMNIKMFFNEGNHDSRGYIENYVRPYLKNKEQVIVLNDQVGYVEANGLNLVGMTNSYKRIIGSVRMALSPDFVENYFPHVEYGIDHSVLITENKSREEIISLEEIIRNDLEFRRTTNDGKDLENKKLDILATHAPIGGSQPFSAAAAFLSFYSQLNIASDTHITNEENTRFGDKAINTGTAMVDVYKDEFGVVQYEMLDSGVEYDETFMGYQNIDYGYLKKRVEEVYKIMRNDFENNIVNENGFSSAKAA